MRERREKHEKCFLFVCQIDLILFECVLICACVRPTECMSVCSCACMCFFAPIPPFTSQANSYSLCDQSLRGGQE